MVDEHRDLLAALQSRDPALMLEQLERHIAVPSPALGSATPRRKRPRERRREAEGRGGQEPGMTELLTVANLRTGFNTHGGVIRAVDGVDFTIEKGEALGVVGESGSGKSVTALSIMRLIDAPGRVEPSSSILFEGRDLATLDEDEMRKVRGNEISMIFQEPMTSLNPVFTVGDQISEAVRLHQNVGKSEADERAVEMMRLVGIPSPEKRVGDYPHQMSGGMRQRVMIGMALSCNPEAADRRRADDCSRRHRAGADPRADERAAREARDGDPPDHARPRGRRRDGGRGRRHVRRQDRRARAR